MEKRVNLVPQKPLAERIKALLPVLLLVLALLLTGFFSLRLMAINQKLTETATQISQAERQADELRLIKEQINGHQASVAKNSKELERRQKLVKLLSRLKGDKRHFARPLALIARALPATIRCRTISFQGSSGTLTGTALDYDDLTQTVQTLQQQAPFSQVVLAVTDRDNNQELERIQFTMTLALATEAR